MSAIKKIREWGVHEKCKQPGKFDNAIKKFSAVSILKKE